MVQQQKSVGVAYLLLLVLGGFGAHHFYLGDNNKGITYLVLFLAGWALVAVIVGFVPLVIVSVLAFIDLFTLHSKVHQYNNQLN